MPLIDHKINDFVKKVVDLTDTPSENMTPAEIKAVFDSSPEELRIKLNALIDDLSSTISGASGAKNIGVETISGLTGNDIQTLLQGLKTITDDKTDKTGNHEGSWQGLDPSMIGAPEMNSARITLAESQLADIVVDVKRFGAVGDGITDDTSALLQTKDYVLNNGGIFFIPANANCYISGNLDLFGLRNVSIQGKVTGASLTNELIIGYTSASIDSTNYLINEITNLKLKIQGLKNSDVKINKCPHLLLFADALITSITSIAYSRFTLGNIDKFEINSINLFGGTLGGWVNENSFYGGRFKEFIMDGTYPHNNNTFYKPVFEGTTITIKKGDFNQFYDCRFEGANSLTFEPLTTENMMVRSWYSSVGAYLRQTVTIPYTDLGNHNMVVNAADYVHSFRKVFEVSPRSNNFNVIDFTRNAETITNGSTKIIWESDYIEIVNDIGFKFESDQSLFRTNVKLFDENKVKITTQPTNFFSSNNIPWNSGIAEYYSSANQAVNSCAMRKGTNVKYVKIVVYAYLAGTFKQARINFLEQKGKETNIITLPKYNSWHSPSIPLTGVWEVGDKVYNNSPAAGGYTGWICVTAGNPGTWKGFGLIQA